MRFTSTGHRPSFGQPFFRSRPAPSHSAMVAGRAGVLYQPFTRPRYNPARFETDPMRDAWPTLEAEASSR